MPVIDRKLRSAIIDLLTPSVSTTDEREALIQNALFDAQELINQIELEGAPRTFTSRLITTCTTYGEIDINGTPVHALVLLLEEFQKQVGIRKKNQADKLILEIQRRVAAENQDISTKRRKQLRSTKTITSQQESADVPPIATLSSRVQHIPYITFSPDGRLLASVSTDRAIRLWNMETHEEATLERHQQPVTTIAFSPDGKMLASGSVDYLVRLWDMVERRDIATLTGHTKRVNSVTFSPDHLLLASASDDGTIRLWNMQRDMALFRTKPRDSDIAVTNVTFSPDNQILAFALADQTIRLWHLRSQEPIGGNLQFHANYLAFSPDGKWLAASSPDSTVKIWQTSDRRNNAILTGHTDSVQGLAFSPDSLLLASASEDGSIRMWDMRTYDEVMCLDDANSPVWSVAFSPDGKVLASAHSDDNIRLWQLPG